MRHWRMSEPSLDELLEDDVMSRMMHRDGFDAGSVRRQLEEVADRLADRPRRSCSGGGPTFK